MNDLGLNFPESLSTLLAQQQQLISGKRPAQMFPKNTDELPLPAGFDRVETERGIFHFDPELVSKEVIKELSSAARENVLLGLGPYSKADILEYVNAGELLLVVTERTPEGIEVKAAAGTKSTVQSQIVALENTKLLGSVISIEAPGQVLLQRLPPV